MKIRNRHKRWIAGILLIVFLFVYIVKGFHTHESYHSCEHICSSHNNDKQNGDTNGMANDGHCHHGYCLVCHFLFAPFTINPKVEINPIRVLLTIARENISEQPIRVSILTFDLRAPPTVI